MHSRSLTRRMEDCHCINEGEVLSCIDHFHGAHPFVPYGNPPQRMKVFHSPKAANGRPGSQLSTIASARLLSFCKHV